MRIRMNKRQMGMILAGAIAASMLIGTTAAYAMPGFGDAMETASEAARAAAQYADDAARMAANDYVFPQSSSEYLIRDDLEGKTGEELRIARNEIYARHGRRFNDKTLQWYFDAKSWYQGTVAPGDFKESVLNPIEKENVYRISQAEAGNYPDWDGAGAAAMAAAQAADAQAAAARAAAEQAAAEQAAAARAAAEQAAAQAAAELAASRAAAEQAPSKTAAEQAAAQAASQGASQGASASGQVQQLTEDELKYMERLLIPKYAGFFTCTYASPLDIIWGSVFYSGFNGKEVEDYNAVQNEYQTVTDEEVFTDVTAIRKTDVEAIVRETTGTEYSQARHPLDGDWVWLPKLRAYAYQHGDTNLIGVNFTGGEYDGEMMRLYYYVPDSYYYNSGISEYAVTLKKNGRGGWYFYSNGAK